MFTPALMIVVLFGMLFRKSTQHLGEPKHHYQIRYRMTATLDDENSSKR